MDIAMIIIADRYGYKIISDYPLDSDYFDNGLRNEF